MWLLVLILVIVSNALGLQGVNMCVILQQWSQSGWSTSRPYLVRARQWMMGMWGKVEKRTYLALRTTYGTWSKRNPPVAERIQHWQSQSTSVVNNSPSNALVIHSSNTSVVNKPSNAPEMTELDTRAFTFTVSDMSPPAEKK